MKNSWIKCSDKLPSLHYVSSTWWVSSPVLVYTNKAGYLIAAVNLNMDLTDKQQWFTNDTTYDLEDILYWQPLESPLLEDLRATQNYHLST